MVRRSPTARFMGGAWVFPGGVVDPTDGSDRVAALLNGDGRGDMKWVAAGVRELVEEVGLWLASPPFVERIDPGPPDAVWSHAERTGVRFDGAAPVLMANWITPTMLPLRFDTRFYVAVVTPDLVAAPDAVEVDAAEWLAPAQALRRAATGALLVPFPTRKTLEVLSGFDAAEDVVSHFRDRARVDPVRPRMRVTDAGDLEALLPDEPGFEEIDETVIPDPDVLRRVAGGSGSPEVSA